METIDQAINLNVSKQEAWEVLADFGNAHKYFNGIVDAYLTSETKTGVGTIRHCDLPKMMGMKQYIDEEITHWQEGECFTYIVTKTAAPIKNGIATWTVKGDDNNATITVHIEFEPKGLMGLLMKNKLQTEFNKQIAGGLNDIKVLLEKGRKLAA